MGPSNDDGWDSDEAYVAYNSMFLGKMAGDWIHDERDDNVNVTKKYVHETRFNHAGLGCLCLYRVISED